MEIKDAALPQTGFDFPWRMGISFQHRLWHHQEEHYHHFWCGFVYQKSLHESEREAKLLARKIFGSYILRPKIAGKVKIGYALFYKAKYSIIRYLSHMKKGIFTSCPFMIHINLAGGRDGSEEQFKLTHWPRLNSDGTLVIYGGPLGTTDLNRNIRVNFGHYLLCLQIIMFYK